MTATLHPQAPDECSGAPCQGPLRGHLEEKILDEAVSLATGVPVASCPLVLKEYLRQFLVSAADCPSVSEAYDMVLLQPHGPVPGLAPADESPNAVSLAFTPKTLLEWQSGLELGTSINAV